MAEQTPDAPVCKTCGGVCERCNGHGWEECAEGNFCPDGGDHRCIHGCPESEAMKALTTMFDGAQPPAPEPVTPPDLSEARAEVFRWAEAWLPVMPKSADVRIVIEEAFDQGRQFECEAAEERVRALEEALENARGDLAVWGDPRHSDVVHDRMSRITAALRASSEQRASEGQE